MEKFTTHTGIGVPLRRSNVDTDQIIPAVYLKRVTRTGFEDGLFSAWRTDESFILNREPFSRGSVLVAGPDFGTGSSREHAVWALMDYGFRVVISSRFADIFRGNSAKGGLLAAQVAQPDVELLWKLLENEPGTEVTVDLTEKTVQAKDLTRALRGGRLHPLAVAGGARRHRPVAATRRGDRRLRGRTTGPVADHQPAAEPKPLPDNGSPGWRGCVITSTVISHEQDPARGRAGGADR